MIPIYTADNCEFAYQLNWGLSVFWRTEPHSDVWLEELKRNTEKDNIRILQHRFVEPAHSQFLISTQPHVLPLDIPARVKGRLQHLIRDHTPKAFQRNYALRTIGSTKRDKLEQYLTSQLKHHRMADPSVQQRLARYQIRSTDTDLSCARFSSHAKYWYNLHVVMVNKERWMEIRDEVLQGLHDMVLKASHAKEHLLSRAAMVPDHIHITLGCRLDESPRDVALSYMNNLAFVYGMRAVFRNSCFVGTFGEYDLGAV